MPDASDNPLAPLKQPLFRSIWIVALISDIGDWMQSVGAGWLMASLTSSPTMVALVQAATNLPTFVLSLPGGALADVVDRKRLLSVTTIWMMVFAAILGVLTVAGTINAWGLLAFTLLIGAGAALESPAWQAITPELVRREDLQAAVALDTAEFNIARAIGPAIGGLLVAIAGAGVNFLVNAASFLVVIIVLRRWRRRRRESSLPAEHFLGAMRAGIRYVRSAPIAKDVLSRTFIFAVCAAALWALLPLIARNELHMSSLGYGVLLGVLGIGALGGAYVLPSLRTKLSRDAVVAIGSTMFAGGTLALALLHNLVLVCVLLFAGGAGWLAAVSTLNVAVQIATPGWVRGRVLSVYQLVFSGSMAVGSIIWGAVAERVGVRMSLVGSAAGLVLGLVATSRFPLKGTEEIDVTPATAWPAPSLGYTPSEDAPALVTVEYLIDPVNAAKFKKAMKSLRSQRLRDGAIRWDLFSEADKPERYLELFFVESWIEHLRQHKRVTLSGQRINDRARSFHIGPSRPSCDISSVQKASDYE